MKKVETFLSSPPISPSIRDIKASLNTPYYVREIHNPDQIVAPNDYTMPFETASVLIALWNSPDKGIQVLLTQRSAKLRNHPGQVAFPGGKMESGDASVIHTALRETEEEVGLKPKNFDVIGQLGNYFSASGFCISPVIAEVTKLTPIMICYDEVDSVHWVPLDYLLNPKNFRFKKRIIADKRHDFFEITYQDIHIWGITAGILYGLYSALTADDIHNHSL